MTEREILIKVKNGDTVAFERLYDCYWLKVYNFAQLYIPSSFEVSEVTQEVFIKVWESRETIDENKNFDGFLFIITRNIIFNYSRQYFNELNFKMTALRGIENLYDMEEELDAADLREYINCLVDQLPVQRRRIFKMSREQNLSNKEIAELCAVSEKAIERQITLALKFIKDNLPLFIVFMG
ncbi:RNA polymerase sigma-70 factor [Bacteroides sp. AN502(2024)]|uniref:RNA polymerase sigma-70 factor n=1 Tax=Bacteroides sp. AN502(2024) TaxID=3160599 RepID=UPI0035196D62